MRLTSPLLLLILALGTASAQTTRIRLLAANTTSGNQQSYEAPGIRIFQGLDPDIVMINEFNVGGNTPAEINAFVANTFGAGFQHFREAGAQIPNGVISRWPILQAGEWDDPEVSNRDFAYARIDIPGPTDLWAISVHFLTSGSSTRNAEAQSLLGFINANIPPGDFVTLGGDFNTGSRTEAAVTTLSGYFVTAAPYPADQNGNTNTNANRNDPYDWVLADAQLDPLETPVIIGSFTFSNGLVFDSRLFAQGELNASFSPVLAGDSGASNMQHMAVVRDFLVPSGQENDFSVAPTEIAFGTVDAAAGPFTDSSVQITVASPFTLSSVDFAGSHPGEFSLVAPALPALLSSSAALTFRWTPPANNGVPRSVSASFTAQGTPSNFTVTLTGATQLPGGTGEPLDASGHRIEQSGSALSLTLPPGTSIAAGGLLVIGRNATRAQFEAFWGPLPADVVYLNGTAITGGNGFPLINGDEQFRILNASLSAVDPLTGSLPVPAMASDRGYRRDATGATAFTEYTAPNTNADPGEFTGTRDQTGRLILTEMSDATGTGNFNFEFVEMLYDAAEPPPAMQGLSLR